MSGYEEPEFITLPSLEDTLYWERNMASGLHQPVVQPSVNGDAPHGNWERVNLADDRFAVKPDPPAIHELLYRSKRHVISGPPESAKTLIAYVLLLEALRQMHPVAIIDFEMGAPAARLLLDELGATREELAAIYYVEPEAPPTPDNITELLDHGAQYVLLDAAAGAYDTSGLDDNARKDAEKFARAWIRPLWTNGVATLVVDHVTKNIDTRGKFTIGSERKVGQADVHLSLEALKPLSRGGSGIVKIHVHKDRPGFLTRPVAVVLDLKSDAEHRITSVFRPPVPTDETGGMKHTIYWERISRELEEHVGPRSQTQIEEAVKGSVVYVRDALKEMLAEGLLTLQTGPRNSSLYTLIHRYRKPPEPVDNSGDDDPVATPSNPVATGTTDPVRPRPPLTGGRASTGRGGRSDPVVPFDVNDPAVQDQLPDDDIPF